MALALMGGAAAAESGTSEPPPQRVVALDHCADQYLLALADPGQIAALSPDATAPFSYQAGAAADLPRSPPKAETLVMARPDRVLRLWGGEPGTRALLERQDIPVTQLAHGTGLDIARENLRRAGDALGAPEAAQRLIARMDRRLARAERRRPAPAQRLRAVYVTPGGATAGAGTFIDAMLRAAGLRNVAAEAGRQGWHSLDLERLALDPPDVIVGGFFGDPGTDAGERPDYWSIARHAFLRRQMDTIPFISLPGRLLTCQAWYITEAVARIQDRLALLPGGLGSNRIGLGHLIREFDPHFDIVGRFTQRLNSSVAIGPLGSNRIGLGHLIREFDPHFDIVGRFTQRLNSSVAIGPLGSNRIGLGHLIREFDPHFDIVGRFTQRLNSSVAIGPLGSNRIGLGHLIREFDPHFKELSATQRSSWIASHSTHPQTAAGARQ